MYTWGNVEAGRAGGGGIPQGRTVGTISPAGHFMDLPRETDGSMYTSVIGSLIFL